MNGDRPQNAGFEVWLYRGAIAFLGAAVLGLVINKSSDYEASYGELSRRQSADVTSLRDRIDSVDRKQVQDAKDIEFIKQQIADINNSMKQLVEYTRTRTR